eukprot:2570280-Prorocentrum_lima.AAC.1
MSHLGATHGVGSESIVNRMAQPKVVYPKHFHSKFEPPLQPPSSASAASSSSGPSTNARLVRPRVPKPKGSDAEKEAVRTQSVKGWEALKALEN